MAGEINAFNSVLWKRVVEQVLDLTNWTIITTETEKEAKLLEGWCLKERYEVR